ALAGQMSPSKSPGCKRWGRVGISFFSFSDQQGILPMTENAVDVGEPFSASGHPLHLPTLPRPLLISVSFCKVNGGLVGVRQIRNIGKNKNNHWSATVLSGVSSA
ncbi:MAG TPA: hypothetical protein VFB72_14475, partial [Verrucomicrobiae bacterium]|nr:hypothetical protein [Verrucomicrobiae bacterium]